MALVEQGAMRVAVQAPAAAHLESYNSFLRELPCIVEGQPPLQVWSLCKWGKKCLAYLLLAYAPAHDLQPAWVPFVALCFFF